MGNLFSMKSTPKSPTRIRGCQSNSKKVKSADSLMDIQISNSNGTETAAGNNRMRPKIT
jgi:hypothetical protein